MEKAHTVSEKAVLCSYPKCGKKGHSAAHCWIKKKDQEKAQLKHAGRSRDPKKTQREPLRKSTPQKYPRRRGPCYVCGAEGYRTFECTERADLKDNKKSAKKSVTLESTRSSKKQKTEIDWNRFTQRSERDGGIGEVPGYLACHAGRKNDNTQRLNLSLSNAL